MDTKNAEIDEILGQCEVSDPFQIIDGEHILLTHTQTELPQGCSAVILDSNNVRSFCISSHLNFHQQRIALARCLYLHFHYNEIKNGNYRIINNEETADQNNSRQFASRLLKTSVLVKKRTSHIV